MADNEHLLKKPSRHVIPEHLIFVDTETTQHKLSNGNIQHSLLLGVAIHTRQRRDNKPNTKEVYRFENISEYWGYVVSKTLSKTVLYLISHNAVFDFTVLQHITNLTRLGYTCQFVFEGGVRFISKWTKKKHTIVILDNSNWFAGKLAKWGKELDLPKLEMPKGLDSKEQWFVYCERDCNILYHLFIWYTTFLKDNDLGSWKYTIASSAFNSFRHRFMSHQIYVPDTEDEQGLPRQSYHGGRTECFQIGHFSDGPFYKLDVNSMYPYVMRKYEYPTCFEENYSKPNMSILHKTLEKRAAIADVTLHTSQPYFCHIHDKRNIYPIGEFRTTLCTEELRLALDNGWVKYVHSCNIYRKRPIFGDYVDFFYSVKVQAQLQRQGLLRAFAKLYLNGLYGKFGQRGYVDYVIGTDTRDILRASHGYNIQTGERYTIRQLGHNVLYSERANEGYNSFCAIASEVTANARLYLYSLVLRIGRENCYYCDTDSIISNERGKDALISLMHDTQLGFLKIEGTSSTLDIVAPKHYRFNEHWTMKGVRANAEKLEHNVYRQEIWPGLNSILKQGHEIYYNLHQVKKLSPTIISGKVTQDGKIQPFVFNNGTPLP